MFAKLYLLISSRLSAKEDVWKAVSTDQFTSLGTRRVFGRLYLANVSRLSAQGGCMEGCIYQSIYVSRYKEDKDKDKFFIIFIPTAEKRR